MSIEVSHLSYSYGNDAVLDDISFSAGSGELIAVLGPNGVGKSTFFNCLLGFLRPEKGSIKIGGKEVLSLSGAEIAGEIAYIPQNSPQTFNYTVLDMVLMGTTHQLKTFSAPNEEQREKAMDALKSLGIAALAQRGSAKISGGERQLMLLARALVQDAKMLVMDEPTANLDYGNSFRVMQQVSALVKKGYSVIFSTHEPNHAFRYASRVIALHGGRIIADGHPAEVLTEKLLERLYGIRVAVRSIEMNGRQLSVSIPLESEEHLL